MESERPLISVIIAVKDRMSTIGRCLTSILKEGYKPLEIIVVDGESKDGTLIILKKFANKYPFIKIISEPDNGQSEARNKGLKIAKGKYVTFQDSDDEMIKGKLKNLSSWLEENPEYFGVFGHSIRVYRKGLARFLPSSLPLPIPRIKRRSMEPLMPITFEELYKKNYIGSGAIMLRNHPDVRFLESLSFGEDKYLWCKLLKKGYKIGHICVDAYFWNRYNFSGETYLQNVDKHRREVERQIDLLR